MSFNLRVVNDKWEVVLLGQPTFIHALQMSPEALEPELTVGDWLVVTFPIWGGRHVFESVAAACKAVTRFRGSIELGIRPLDHYREVTTWWPESQSPPAPNEFVVVYDGRRPELHISTDFSGSPLWLILSDGKKVYSDTGPRTESEVCTIISSALALLLSPP